MDTRRKAFIESYIANGGNATKAKLLEWAARSLGVINKDAEQVRRDEKLSPEQKRQQLDTLTIERNALIKRAVNESRAAQKEAAK